MSMLKAYRVMIATIGAGMLWTLNAGAWRGDALGADKATNEEELLFAGQFLWASSTTDHACYRLAMQSDGNLVTYKENGANIWDSATVGRGGYARMQTDGNFVIYDYADSPVWWTSTSTTGRLNQVIQQADGNLVVYKQLGPNGLDLVPAWSSGRVMSDPHTMLCPQSQKMHVTYNRTGNGSDFHVFPLAQARSSWCGYYCAANPSCVSYAYAPPGTEQAQAVCHLKGGLVSPTPATGFVFGIKTP